MNPNAPAAAFTKVPVTPKALARRVARELSRRGLRLRSTRNPTAVREGRRLYVHNTATAEIVSWHPDVFALARELGLLAAHEEVV